MYHLGDTTETPTAAPTPTPTEPRQGPTVVNPIEKQVAQVGDPFQLPLQNVFQDVAGRTMTLRMTTCDGSAWPSWLTVQNGPNQPWKLMGVANESDVMAYCLTATVTDNYGEQASDSFYLAVSVVITPAPIDSTPSPTQQVHGNVDAKLNDLIKTWKHEYPVVKWMLVITVVASVVGAVAGTASKVIGLAQYAFRTSG